MLIQKDKRKDYPNPWDKDERVKVTIFPNEHNPMTSRESVRFEINGHVGMVPIGQEVEIPKSVLNDLKNMKSVISSRKGGMAIPHPVDSARGGERSERTASSELNYVNDFTILER